MSDEIDSAQIDWSQLLDLEGGGPCSRRGSIPDEDRWFNASYDEGNGRLAFPDVHPALQQPEHSEFNIPSEWDWMSDLNAGLPSSVGFPNGQLIVPVPGLPAPSGPSGELPYDLATPSPHQRRAVANGTASAFDFVSGCRPIGVIAQTTPERGIEAESLTCIWPNCSSKRTFKRTYELQRHMNKHMSVKYHCTVANCPLRKATAFYRLDKFRDHLRNSHSQDDLVSCPVPTCTTGPLPLFLFVTHVNFHTNSKANSWYHALHALQEYDRGSITRPCPFEGCRKWLFYLSVPAHLHTHELEDLMKHKDGIAEAGYEIPSGHVICPACKQTSTDHYEFAEHFTLHHLTLDSEHFAAWRSAYRSHRRFYNNLLPWKAWNCVWWPGSARGPNLVCPACGPEKLRCDRESTHHLELLAPFDWIDRSLQKKVLNLWPDFATHPVFSSIHPTIHRRGNF